MKSLSAIFALLFITHPSWGDTDIANAQRLEGSTWQANFDGHMGEPMTMELTFSGGKVLMKAYCHWSVTRPGEDDVYITGITSATVGETSFSMGDIRTQAINTRLGHGCEIQLSEGSYSYSFTDSVMNVVELPKKDFHPIAKVVIPPPK